MEETSMRKLLEAAVENGLQPEPAQPQPPVMRPEPTPLRRPATLVEQMSQLERIERELANRMRREGVEIKAAADRKVTDAHAQFERELSEQTARLERERDEMVRQAIEEYHLRINELAALLRQRP